MKKYLKVFVLMLISSYSFAGDDIRYDQKRRLLCEAVSIHPALSDFFAGDMRKGWLRIVDNRFYSIEIGGWVVTQYSSNDGDSVVDNNRKLIIREYGIANLDKQTGRVQMNIGEMSIRWDCNIGPHQPANKEY